MLPLLDELGLLLFGLALGVGQLPVKAGELGGASGGGAVAGGLHLLPFGAGEAAVGTHRLPVFEEARVHL